MKAKSINIVSLLEKYGGIATGKAFMKYIGIDCGKFRVLGLLWMENPLEPGISEGIWLSCSSCCIGSCFAAHNTKAKRGCKINNNID